MTRQYIIDIEDLNDKGLLIYLSKAVQKEVLNLKDWNIFGPMIEQFRIDISYLDSPSTMTLSLRGEGINEPWSASIENAEGSFSQWGNTPPHAIAKTIIELHMKGSELNIPRSEVETLLRYPDLVEQSDID